MAMLRLAPITKGTVLVDGFDLSSLSSDAVRSFYNVVPQASVILPGSVRANLDPNNAHDRNYLHSLLAEVGLLDLIISRGGLDVGIDAVGLSQGQKQLFCIVRSFTCNDNKKILLLDESTSSMDSQTEAIAMDFIRNHFAFHTLVAIAHRLETIKNFDVIVVLDEGMLVEYGTPDALLARDGGYFRRLWAQRAGHNAT